jgi:hypothetical protein
LRIQLTALQGQQYVGAERIHEPRAIVQRQQADIVVDLLTQ